MSSSYSNDLLSQKIYWLNKLSGELPKTNLILDYIRPLFPIHRNKSLSFDLSNDLSQAIIRLAKGSYFSTYWILVSALKILLQKYTRNHDVIVGIPIYEEIATDCLNNKVLPLRTQITPQLSFKDFLFQVKDAIIGAYSHQNSDFAQLIKLLDIPTSPNCSPLFDLVVLLENIHHKNHFEQLNNDITISFTIEGESIGGNINYSQHLFQDDTIKLMSKYYNNVLESIMNNLDITLSEIVFLKDFEQDQLLKEFNNNQKLYPIEQTINQLFETQVSQNPNQIAVIHQQQKLTYQQLNAKANQLARLLRQLGICKGEFIGIFKDRNLDFLIAILAIYKAGGAYVPIDSTYPPSRIKYMLSHSEVRFLLTDFSELNDLSTLRDADSNFSSIICLDQLVIDKTLLEQTGLKIYDQRDFNCLTHDNLERINDAADPAYMLYTSGSTGLPKGAIVRHDGAVNHIYAQFDELELNSDFCFLQSAPSSTDISVWQFLAPVLIGGKTVIVPLETVAIPQQLFQALKSQEITVVELVPALFGGLLEYISQLPIEHRQLPCLKWMMVVGEPVSISWVNQWLYIYPKIKIANAYGPTEAADDITQFIVDKPFAENQRAVPIGKPLANLSLYILDEQMQLLPIGVPGEICVSGIGVGDGYWNNQQKTDLSFVANPFDYASQTLPANRSDVIYKTGDLGRWLPDGNIEFLGRIDHQVKIRGFRVELGEIETFLAQHPNVRENLVVVEHQELGSLQLLAYVVAKTLPVPSVSNLRGFLKQKLPDYMLPSAFIFLQSLPLAPSGKVDRKALPKPEHFGHLGNDYVAPRNEAEATIAKIWQPLLGIKQISIYDNFFELGGHSLIATRVISQIRQIFQVELPLRCLFEKPTIFGLAKEIEQAIKVNLGVEVTNIERIERSQQLPLSFAQTRLWFLDQLEPNNTAYNIFNGIHLSGTLNIGALERSLNEIVRRHEALRTSFQTVDGQPIQIIAPTLILTFPIVDLCESSPAEREKEIHRLATQEVLQPFDLAQCPLLRVTLIKLNAEEHIILLTMHHIISDAWSMGVLVEEVAALYPAFCTGRPSLRDATRTPLPELPIQYADFAVWQRQWLQGEVLQTQLDYWKQQLGNTSPRLTLPKPPLHSTIETNQGAKQSFTLSEDLTEAINLLSRQQGVTLFMTLLAVFQVLLYCFTGTEDIRIGSPIANRNRVEIEKLIGFFINTLVLRIDLSANPSFRELLVRSRQVTLEAYAHQDLPFEKLVEELQPERNLNHNPLYQAWFVLENTPMPQLELPGLTLTPLEVESGTARHDLLLAIWESPEGLNGTFEYKTDLFNKASISQLIRYFEILLRYVIARPDTTLNELATMLAKTDREQQEIKKQELQAAEHQKLKMTKRKTIRN